MANKVKISLRAQKDLIKSYEWYEEQSIGLGDRFSKIIYSDINVIAKDPFIYKKVKRDLREFVVDEVPFLIIYECDDDIINIIRIFHTSRNPRLKYRRK